MKQGNREKQERQAKLRRRVDAQTARDHTFMRRWSERRYQRIRRGTKEPVLPKFVCLCALGLFAGTFLAVTGDIAAGLRSGSRVLRRAADSAFSAWLLFSVMLIPACIFQLKTGFDHPWFEQHSLNRKGRRKTAAAVKTRRLLTVSAAGLVLLAVLNAVL